MSFIFRYIFSDSVVKCEDFSLIYSIHIPVHNVYVQIYIMNSDYLLYYIFLLFIPGFPTKSNVIKCNEYANTHKVDIS